MRHLPEILSPLSRFHKGNHLADKLSKKWVTAILENRWLEGGLKWNFRKGFTGTSTSERKSRFQKLQFSRQIQPGVFAAVTNHRPRTTFRLFQFTKAFEKRTKTPANVGIYYPHLNKISF